MPDMDPPPTGLMPTGPLPAAPVPPPLEAPPHRFPAPSPLGLAMALVGLLLVCTSVLIPRISIEYDQEDRFGYSSPSFYSGEGPLLGSETVIPAVALLAFVGLSASGAAAWRWPSRVAAGGIALFGSVFAYHPVSAARESLSGFTDFDGKPVGVEVTAESGVYLMVFGLLLLAASTCFMHVGMRRAVDRPPPPTGAGPGATVTVSGG